MTDLVRDQQADLGAKIAAQRKALGVRAQSAARAAGISRVTLHRIEKGEASVSLGAYVKVCHALGLHLGILAVNGGLTPQQPQHESLLNGSHVRIADYPQLTALAWQLDPNALLTDEEVIGIYERNQRFMDLNQLDDHERLLMQRLILSKGMENFFV